MNSRLVAFTMALVSAAGCSTVPQIPKRDYAHAIIGSWFYSATHSGENIQRDLIVVFHAGGRLGVRTRAPHGFGPEDWYVRHWRIEDDRLTISGPDSPAQPETPWTDRIIAFTPDEIVTVSEYSGTEKISVIEQATRVYKRIQQQRDTPNQTMQRTPTRRSPQISHD
jgi:hypothetical protein